MKELKNTKIISLINILAFLKLGETSVYFCHPGDTLLPWVPQHH